MGPGFLFMMKHPIAGACSSPSATRTPPLQPRRRALATHRRAGANEGRGADLADGKVDKGWDFKASVYNRLDIACSRVAFRAFLFRLCFGLSACALPLKTKLLVADRFHFLR